MLNMIVGDQGPMKKLPKNPLVKTIKRAIVSSGIDNVNLLEPCKRRSVCNSGGNNQSPHLLETKHQLSKRTLKERETPERVGNLATG